MRLQYCQLLRSAHLTHKLRCAKAQDCFPVLAFDLISERTLGCGDNFWSDFLRSIALVVKAFQRLETQLSPHGNMQQEQSSLAICWTAWIVLQPFSSLHAYTLPPRRWTHVDRQKTGSRLVGRRRRLRKPSMGTRWRSGDRQMVRSTSLPEWVAMIVLMLWYGLTDN